MIPDEDVLQRQIQLLRRTRSRLEPVVHSGPAEARKVWRELERRWIDLDHHWNQRTEELDEPSENARKRAAETMAGLRKGYDRLAGILRRPRSDDRWGHGLISIDRLAERASRSSGRVASAVGDLADAAKDRLRRVRIDRAHLRKRAELGTRVYELARMSGCLESGALRPPNDDEVTAILEELGSLDADLERRVGASRA
jgi:hypothetical protein